MGWLTLLIGNFLGLETNNTRKIIYTRPDGGVSIVHPVRNTVGETLTTDAEIEQRAWDKLPAYAITPRYIEVSEIPADRTFRDAWKADFTIDLDKAKAIHTKRLQGIEKAKVPDLPILTTDAIVAATTIDELILIK